MKITPKLLSIPPYISTSWKNISALHTEGADKLVITLAGGNTVSIPHLPRETIEEVYAAHSAYLEHSELPSLPSQFFSTPPTAENMKFGINFGDQMGNVMQHSPDQRDMPDLPEEILERIGALAKVIAPDDVELLPKPEEGCNCIYCQLSRAIRKALGASDFAALASNEEPAEEIVSEEELGFCQWDIVQSGDQLYTVINRLDAKERYSVYLGHPVGCTCGKQGCDHVLAVLRN